MRKPTSADSTVRRGRPIAFSAKLSGSMFAVPAKRRLMRLATRSRFSKPTSAAPKRARRRSKSIRPTRGASSIPMATLGSGARTTGIRTIRVRRRTALYGPTAMTVAVSSAVVPGSTIREASARPSATGTPPTTGSTASASVSGGRLPPSSLPLYPEGPRCVAPWPLRFSQGRQAEQHNQLPRRPHACA